MNYKAIKHTFKDISHRKSYFVEHYTEVLGENTINDLIDLGFLTAPASTKYHGHYEGGLFDHSVNVAVVLADLSHYNNLDWTSNSQYLSPLKIGILHDLCKIDQYKGVLSEDNTFIPGVYEWNDDPVIKGHGTKSIIYAQLLGIKLNAEELACIAYHMGAFTDSKEWKDYNNAISKYPNVLWTHTADMIASHIMEV